MCKYTIYTQLHIKSALEYSNVMDYRLILHGEGIMSHIFPHSHQGGKVKPHL